MSRGIQVRTLEPREYDVWNEFVASSPTGSVYAMPEYLDALSRAAGGRFFIRGAFRGDDLVGGMGVYQEGEGFGTVVSPRLLLFYNGPVLRNHATRYPGEGLARDVATLTALESSLRRDGFGRIVLKARSPLNDVRPFLERGWTARPSYTLVVPLQDLDAYWKRVDGNVRRLVRRARQEGIQVAEDDDFDAFFQLHRRVHERKGAPLYLSRQPFEAYFKALRAADLVRLYHARLQDGRPVAGQLVLMNGHPVTHTVSAASDGDHGKAGASVFLRCEVFADLHRRGYRANDLTGAALGSVTRFKRQFGGDLEACFEISRTRPGFHALRMPALLTREGRGWARRILSPLRGNHHAH